jgi:hypothetical protein
MHIVVLFLLVLSLTASSVWAQSAEVSSLWQVDGAKPGAQITLWAQVTNTSQSALPADALVWFYTQNQSWSRAQTHWIGNADVSNLSPGQSKWFSIHPTIAQNFTGGWQYYAAQVWSGNNPLSKLSAYQPIVIAGKNSPVPADLLAPSSTISDTRPLMQWAKVDDSSWYRLWIADRSDCVLDQWYRAENICQGSTCNVRLDQDLESGEYEWRIQTWNPQGDGEWSQGKLFSVSPKNGGLYTYLTDDQNGTYENVYVTIDEILVHQADNGTQGGWYTAAEVGNATFDLITLQDTSTLLDVTEEIPPGKITQIRMMLGETSNATHPYSHYVVRNGTSHELTVPSGNETGIKIKNHNFMYNDNSTLSLTLDFNATESVHQAGRSGKWILRPVIHATHETENGTLKIESQYLQYRNYASEEDEYKGSITLQRGRKGKIAAEEISQVTLEHENGTEMNCTWSFYNLTSFYGQQLDNGTIQFSSDPNSSFLIFLDDFLRDTLPEGHYVSTVQTKTGEVEQKSLYFPGHKEIPAPELNATLDNGHIHYSWTSVEGADQYNLYCIYIKGQDDQDLLWSSLSTGSTQANVSLQEIQRAIKVLEGEGANLEDVEMYTSVFASKLSQEEMPYARGISEYVPLTIPLP